MRRRRRDPRNVSIPLKTFSINEFSRDLSSFREAWDEKQRD